MSFTSLSTAHANELPVCNLTYCCPRSRGDQPQ